MASPDYLTKPPFFEPMGSLFFVPTGSITGPPGWLSKEELKWAETTRGKTTRGSYSADNTTTPGKANKPPEEENGEGEEQLKKKPRKGLPPYVRDMYQEERKIYNKTVVESDGFDCPYVPPEVVVPGILKPVDLEGITDLLKTNASLDEEDTNTLKETLKGLDDMAALALKDYDQQTGKLYQFVKVVKACKSWGGGSTNNITFQAKEDTPGSAPQNFQARVFRFLGNTKVEVFRL